MPLPFLGCASGNPKERTFFRLPPSTSLIQGSSLSSGPNDDDDDDDDDGGGGGGEEEQEEDEDDDDDGSDDVFKNVNSGNMWNFAEFETTPPQFSQPTSGFSLRVCLP